MRKLKAGCFTILMAVVVLVFANTASAHSWGNKCEAFSVLGGNTNTHCYLLASRSSNAVGSIDEVAVTAALSFDWGEPEVFSSDEEWVSFKQYPGKWIETGDITGAGYNCCGVHAFWAEYNPSGESHIYISPGEQAYNQYSHYLLYDTNQDGVWNVYVGCSPGSEQWCLVVDYGGWPVRMSTQEAGQEVADFYEPHDAALDKVAYWENGSSPWYPWSGVTVNTYNRNNERVPQICYKANHEIATPGDLEYHECGGEPAPNAALGESTPQATGSSETETVFEEAPAGEVLSAKIQATPHGDAAPTGKYRAIKRIAGTNAVVEEYVGNKKPTSATLEYGLVGVSSEANPSSDLSAPAAKSSHAAIASIASTDGDLTGKVVARAAAPRRPVQESPQKDREVRLKMHIADGEINAAPPVVTNGRGRFSFKVAPGVYLLEVPDCGPGGTRSVRVERKKATHITVVCGK